METVATANLTLCNETAVSIVLGRVVVADKPWTKKTGALPAKPISTCEPTYSVGMN